MNNRRSWAAAVAAVALMGPGTASAALVLFSDFEEANVPFGGFAVFGSADGWTAGAGTAGIEIQDHAAGDPAPTGGQQFVELDSHPPGPTNSSMYYDFTAAGLYTVSFLYSPRPGVPSASNPISVYLSNVLLAPPGTVTGAGGGVTSWMSYSSNTFFAAANTRLEFRAEGTADQLGGYVDNIAINSVAVPEPSTWAMMLLGFGGLGALLRRRRAACAAA